MSTNEYPACLGHLPEAELCDVHGEGVRAAGVGLSVDQLKDVVVLFDRRRVHHVAAVGAGAEPAAV